MVITLIVLALLPPIFETITGSNTASQEISTGTAQARLALGSMSSQIQSATQICLPTYLPDGTTIKPGYSVLVHTLAYGSSEWAQWTVKKQASGQYQLEEQQWPYVQTTAAVTRQGPNVAAANQKPVATTTAATAIGITTATLNGSVNPNGNLSTYYFQYGTTANLSGAISTANGNAGSGSTAVAESAPVTGLSPNTTYYFRIVVLYGSNKSVNGNILSFTTSPLPAPTVVTQAATAITTTTATLNGTVNPNGLATTYYFEYGTTTSYGTNIPATPGTVGSGTSAVAELANITGLIPNTTYHFQLVATNATGTSYGGDVTFTSALQAPTVVTQAATGIAATSAILNGTVNPNGAATTYYFEYGTTTAYGTNIPATPASAGSGTSAVAELASISGLSPNTTYHFQLVATNTKGTTDGGDLTFKTQAPAPTVVTTAASSVTGSTATFNGTINPNGLDTTYYFEYGTTTAYGQTTAAIDAGSGSSVVSVTVNVSGFNPNTTYHFQLVATNVGGTTFGGDQQFTTLATGPTVSMLPSTCVTPGSATINGTVNPNGSTTTYYFQYGTTTSYGTQTPTKTAGAGTTAVDVSASISGLTPGQTYDVQLVATNATGTTYSQNLSLTTSAATSPPQIVVATPISNATAPGDPSPFTWQDGSTSIESPISNGSPEELVIDLFVSEGSHHKQQTLLKSKLSAMNTPYGLADYLVPKER